MTAEIMAAGLNPAWQKTIFLPELNLAEVNRADAVSAVASGKGINFVRAASIWNKIPAFVFQAAGGITGDSILDGLKRESLRQVSVRTQAQTRTCSTLICRKTRTATEIIEPSGTVLPHERQQLWETAERELRSAPDLALCGTFPPGISSDFYLELARKTIKNGKKVILDAYRDVLPVLESGTISILKINRHELAKLTENSDVSEAGKFAVKQFRLEAAAITDGPGKATLVTPENEWTFSIPALQDVVNPIGAGDTCSAVFFQEYLSGTPLPKAFALGLAAASASCMTEKPAFFDPAFALKLKENIKIIITK